MKKLKMILVGLLVVALAMVHGIPILASGSGGRIKNREQCSRDFDQCFVVYDFGCFGV